MTTSQQELLATWLQRLAPPSRAEDSTAQVTNNLCPADKSLQPAIPVERLLLSIARSAMACEFEVLLNQHQYSNGPERALEALEIIERLENKLSVYKTHSDLSLLNRFGAKRPVAISTDTLALLQLAQDIHGLTGGAFDVTAGSLSDAWGFSRRQGELPTPEKIASALEFVGSQLVQLDTALSQASLTRDGVKTNPGGIGKGYALDRAAHYLAQAGIDDYLIHGGLSSVIARGDRQHPSVGGGWLVSLRHPLRLEQVLGTIRLRDQALGTSGSGKQFFHFGGQRYSHIIDPRTGWPAQGMLSATVICRSGAVADALATALFVMGSEKALEFCAQHPAISAILLVADKKRGHPRIELANTSQWQWLAASSDGSPTK
jgi:thiamine biosynthesis lipoprotein